MINQIILNNRLTSTGLYKKPTKYHLRGINAIIDYSVNVADITDWRKIAYILATAYHETARTFEAIDEFGKGKGKPYGQKIKQSKRRYLVPDKLYFGRGLVQLTWYENYERFGKFLGIDLLNNPELCLNLNVSVKILVEGMQRGMFTGVGLDKYFNDERCDYVNARKIINGMDRAELIAGYANKFLFCLNLQ
jgi:predicted chitinase